jgi:glycine dehydrogenase
MPDRLKTEPPDTFSNRHIGPSQDDVGEMLALVGADSLEDLIGQTVPESIRLKRPLSLPPAQSEYEYLEHLQELAGKNIKSRSFIGLGYYETIIPSVILRNVLENPGWYTPYTPYQAEIAQGRLESLLNFQTLVTELTAMEVANASLLDEGTAAAEAMTMLYRIQSRNKKNTDRNRFVVGSNCFPQTIEVIQGRAEPLGIQIECTDPDSFQWSGNEFGAYVQTPDRRGALHDLTNFIESAHARGALVAVGADLLALTMIRPPGEMGADVVLGSTQRFGVPMGYGGPHAAFFAARESYVREMPGRIIGVSADSQGRPGYRMALQTREQHIRREKAKSNICTAQALPANLAACYAVYHGPNGLRAIARNIHRLAATLRREFTGMGIATGTDSLFDTVFVPCDSLQPGQAAEIQQRASSARLNLNFAPDGIGISLGEPASPEDVERILDLFRCAGGSGVCDSNPAMDDSLLRTSDFLQQDVFNRYHSETEFMRYARRLEQKDIGLDQSMIPLGSCTMKLNAATEMRPITWPMFADLHPFAPADQAEGYRHIVKELEQALCEVTGFHSVSLQPNSGAQGEYAGLLAIRAFHLDRGDNHRDVVLIPASAHGTNPASAVLAGMRVVLVTCDDRGNIDLKDLSEQAASNRERLAALMITYPSTHGVFEAGVRDVCKEIHDHGGLVYMDGANLNAQLGVTSPALIGADVCHLNLHKTFSIPHGGGGPGMGPIAVTEQLAPYLPGHPLVPVGSGKALPAVSSAPWGSALILLIPYGYIKMLGAEGMTHATRVAILNANYMKARLEPYYPVLFTGDQGRVAHEVIFDLREFKASVGVTETDVAKRLMDYGFHAPTVSWPVPGTMMVEPTESESKTEIDRFCDALVSIRAEIAEIADGSTDLSDNVLKNAPHCLEDVVADRWSHDYSREKAAFPLAYLRSHKMWPAVGRIDDTAGDRNLVCTCPPLDAYASGSK